MWRVESTLAGTGAGGMGVMVCGGGAVCDEEAPAPDATPAPSAPRRVVNVGHQQYSTLPTLPARRALLSGNNGFVDNATCVGAPTAVLGSNFGSAKAQHSPADIAAGPVVAAAADILSNNKPVQVHTHMDVLNKLAGLHMADDRGTASRGREWRSAYALPKAPGSHEKRREVLAPASLVSSVSPRQSKPTSAPQSPAAVAAELDDEGSRPTSESLCSSSGSDDGSEDGISEDDAAGVFGDASSHRAPQGGGHHSGAGRKDFCLGIRWFIRNNKLVVGSFSSWCVADKMGIKHGDILRAVDGVDVLNMVADVNCDHPAKELLKGVYGSKCKLHVMRVDAGQVQDMMKRPGSAAGQKLILHDVHVEIPRLIAADP